MKKKKIVSIFFNKKASTITGAWTFYFLMGIFPLTFLLIIAFNAFNINLYEKMIYIIPAELKEGAKAIFSVSKNATKSVTIVLIVSVIFSGSTLFNQMSKDGEIIYEKNELNKKGIKRRFWAIVALFALFVIFLVVGLVIAFYNYFLKTDFFDKSKIIIFLMFFAVILLGYSIIILFNKYIAPINVKLKTLLLGSLVSLFIEIIGTILFVLYIRFIYDFSVFYGNLTGIIVFALWIYLLMFGLVEGVFFNCYLAKTGISK